MINKQRFGRTLNRFSLRSFKLDRQWLVSSLAALTIFGCVHVMGADPIQLPVVWVVASADDGNVAVNTLDKNLATRWSAQGDGQWIFFDLGSHVTVGSAKIAWHQGDQRTARFDVQTSADGANWTTVFSGASSGTTLGLETCNVADSVGRYVRIVGHGNSASLWNSITEVEIYGATATTTPPPPPPSGATLLTVQSVAASSYDKSFVPANTLDRSLTTRWSAFGEGQWILFNLGSSATLTSARIAWHKGVQRTCEFDIQTSADGQSWTRVFSGASSGSTIALESYNVTDSVGKYVRIVGYGSSANLWNDISEVELYGFAGTGSTTPPPPSLPTVTVTASDASASETGAGRGTFTISRTGNLTAGLTVRYSVGGTAGNGTDYVTLSSSLTIPAGAASATVTVTPVDDTAVEGSETFILTLSADAAYIVGSPNSATVTIADNDQATPALPTVTVAASDANASETGASTGTFTISRTGVTTAGLTVRYSLGGTAVKGSDYASLSGSLTIPAGAASATVTVTPIDDTAVEGNETVILTVSADAAYTVGSPNTATVTIADNDQTTPSLPTVTVAASDANGSETGAGTGTFTISRTGVTTAGLTVRYSLGGAAGKGTDYASLSGSLTIPAGAASATVTVTPIDDTTVEGNETVTLTVSADATYNVGSPNNATVTIADNDQAPVNSALPSGILNLTNWKLTLPVETSHAGSPDEIRQPELNTFQDAQYFHVNGTRNGVVFKAHCGGATTSGSGYPRSELREMVSNGSANASWSTTSGTHTMEITQAITHRPVAKPHVVVGQVHDASDDVIVFRLEGSKLFIDENGEDGPVLTTNYQLGTTFTVKFVARNGGVECYYNGQYIYTYSVSTSGCYFKAGCYTQSNTSTGDSASAYGEVVIYSLSVRHE